jgi:hypothetical protein
MACLFMPWNEKSALSLDILYIHLEARDRSLSPRAKASLRARRELLVPTLVLTWTSEDTYILCPFASCQKVHRHGYVSPREWLPNSRLSHCESSQQEYKLLFPFEDDLVVNSFGVEVHREKCIWRTVSGDLEDPRAKEEDMSHFGSQLATTSIEDEYLLDKLEDEERLWFLYGCVCNDPASCESILQSSPNPGRLVKGNKSDGNSALSLAYMDDYLEIVELLYKYNAELENINKEGKTLLIVALSYGHGAIATYLIAASASVIARDNEEILVLNVAKSTLMELEEMEWL